MDLTVEINTNKPDNSLGRCDLSGITSPSLIQNPICYNLDQLHMHLKLRLILSCSILVFFLLQVRSQNNTTFHDNHPNVHKIEVKDVLQTTSYTYLQIEEDGVLQWLAIPKMEANVGETYYFQGGMEMRDFKSKELDRSFHSILFLNGVISPEVVEGGGTALNVSPQKSKKVDEKLDVTIEPIKGGITISELFSNKEKYENQIVKIKGKVTKFNSKIMSRNWIHLQDGTGDSGDFDLTATTTDEAKVGDIITIEGIVILDKDFGAGYFYNLIMENCRIVGLNQ